MSAARAFRRLAWTAAIGVAAGRLAMVAAADIEPATLFFAAPDDAFYYLQIAWNLAHGHGSTFDGIHPTNGYQPAWCAVLAVVARVVAARETLFRASAWLASGLLIVAALGIARLSKRLFRCSWPLAAFLAWALAPRADWFLALESPLNACSLVLVLLASLRAVEEPRGEGPWLAAGFALALSILARLDNLAVALPFLLLVRVAASSPASDAWRRSAWRRAAALAAPTVILVGAYFVFNRIAIGAALPVSGTAKLDMHRSVLVHWLDEGGTWRALRELGHAVAASWLAGPGHHLGGWLVREPSRAPLVASLASVCVAICGIWLAWVPLAGGRKGRPYEQPTQVHSAAPPSAGVFASGAASRVWRAFTAGVALHFAGMVAFVGVFPREWHFVPESLWLTLALVCGAATLVERIVERVGSRRLRGMLRATIGVLLAAWPLSLALDGVRAAEASFVAGHAVANHQLRMARHFGAALPPGTRVGAWNAGYLAFFSDLVVVNLDGLVNRPGFVGLVERIGWDRYFADEGIRYVIDTWGGAFSDVASRGRILERQRFGSSFEYALVEVARTDEPHG